MPVKIVEHKGTILTAVKSAKEVFAEHNITIEEIKENTNVDESLIMVLLDDTNGVMDALSKVLAFGKIRFVQNQRGKFKVYGITVSGKLAKITRKIEPRAVLYYDLSTGKFHGFRWRAIVWMETMSKERKQVIVNEMIKFAKSKNLEI